MKCAIVIPSWIPEEIFSSKTAGSQINYWQPLGTLYVASSILDAGYDVKFLNGAFMSNSEIINEIVAYKPDVVGLYSTTFGWNKAVLTASEIRNRLNDIFIAVGGPYPVAVQENVLKTAER